MIKNKMIGKYRVELIDDNDKFYAKVYNTNAKKWASMPEKYIRFMTVATRDEYVAGLEKNVAGWEKMKTDRKAERMNFKNPAKVGDILVASWGYDQTNVDYYQVTAVKGKMVELKSIRGKTVEGTEYSHGMADMVQPVKDSFINDDKTLKRFVRASYKDYCVSVSQCASAYKIEPSEKNYRSWYA